MELFLLINFSNKVNRFARFIIPLSWDVKLGWFRQKPHSYSTYHCQESSKGIDIYPVLWDKPIVNDCVDSHKTIIELKNCTNKGLSILWEKLLHVEVGDTTSTNTSGTEHKNQNCGKDPIAWDQYKDQWKSLDQHWYHEYELSSINICKTRGNNSWDRPSNKL